MTFVFFQVTYKDHRTYIFMPEFSRGSPEDMLYAINAPMVALDKLVTAKLPGDLAKSLLQPILEGLIDKHNEKLGKLIKSKILLQIVSLSTLK